MLIMLIVMWYLCKHVPYYLVDHGNLIKIRYTMVETISILLFIITLLPMTPDSILKDDINRANKAKQEKIRVKIRLWQKNLSNK